MGLNSNYRSILSSRTYNYFTGWRIIDLPDWFIQRLIEIGALQRYFAKRDKTDE